MKVAIIGCGMLGYDLIEELKDGYELHCFDINVGGLLDQKINYIDITNFSDTYCKLTKLNPDVIINTSSITDVDKCEEEPDLAYRVNSIGVKNVSIAASRFDSLLVYISTDYVFDGTKKEPYIEFDEPNPINIYGKSKLYGEIFVREITNKHLIIRTSWLFGKKRINYITKWRDSIFKNEPIYVLSEQYGCPTYTKDLARNIRLLIENKNLGTYHLTNLGYTDRLSVAKEIIKCINTNYDVQKISLLNGKDLFKKARRPEDVRLKNFIWELENMPKIRSWQEALKEFLSEL